MVSGVHLQGYDKKEVQVQGVKRNQKTNMLHPCQKNTFHKDPAINIIVCFAKLMHNFWDYANCETL